MRSVREKTFTKYVSSLIGVTSHITPLPAGEGLGEGPPPHGLEMCAKNLRELCELCERKNSPACLKNVLFLTEGHRWTEHTKVHRDIKSTDITEPYSHRSITPLPHSFQEHALLHSRTCPSTSKNTPFLMLDKALLHRSLQHPDFMYVTETDKAYILNGNLIYKDRMTEWHR